jgi:signal peptidase I
MFDKWRRYSYAAQKNQRYRLLRVFLCFLALYILYNILTTFFFSVRLLENDTMQPGLRSGDRLVFSSFAIHSLLSNFNSSESLPFKRGNIVLVDMNRGVKKNMFVKVLDGFVRFVTAQRVDLFKNEEQLYIKRVIGLPGDEIVMTNFILRVKPRDGAYSFTEFELSDTLYVPVIPPVPAIWDESMPFSGNMDRIILGEDECFVLADDRSNTNDSRTWGPVPVDHITGKLIFRYWPPAALGSP